MKQNHQCKNCGASYQGYFCNHCGQKRIVHRWTIKNLIGGALAAFLNFEKGYFFTFKKMLTNPGEVVQNYLHGNTVNYSNPFRYALIGIAISTFFLFSLGIWDLQVDTILESYKELGIIKSGEDEVVMRSRMYYVTKFMNFIPFFLIPFISLSSKLLFEQRKLYYAEHFIMNTFMLGQATLYGLFNLILVYFVPDFISAMMVVGFAIAALIYSQMFHYMFGTSRLKGFFLGLLVYGLGFLFFIIFCGVIGLILGILFAVFFAIF